MKILLADDSATSRHMAQRAVEGLGHECRVTKDGLEAWTALQDFDAEVVISDWVMPGMDGEELCRRVRAASERPYVYFVMLTSLEDRVHVLRGMEAGAATSSRRCWARARHRDRQATTSSDPPSPCSG